MYYVEMVRKLQQEKFAYFGCHGGTWELLLKLGRENGWQPSGTQCPQDSQKDWEAVGGFESTYNCEDFPKVKTITLGDAENWAQALEVMADRMGDQVLPFSDHARKFISERYHIETLGHLMYGVRANFINRFARFLRQGGFIYFWEDGAGPIPRNEDQNILDDWFDYATSAWDVGDLKGAEIAYLQLTQMAPNIPTLWFNLGMLYRSQGLHLKAIEAHQRATVIAPESWEAWQYLGNSFFEDKRFEEAISAHKKAVQYGPEKASCWSGLGSAFSRCQAYQEANAAHQRALGLEPGDPRWVSNYAVNLRESGDLEGAIQVLLPLAPKFPNLGAMQENLGKYLMDVKRFAEALPYLERASALDPKAPELVRRQVICHLEMKDLVNAKRSLLEHLALEPCYKPSWELLLQLNPTTEERALAEHKLREV